MKTREGTRTREKCLSWFHDDDTHGEIDVRNRRGTGSEGGRHEYHCSRSNLARSSREMFRKNEREVKKKILVAASMISESRVRHDPTSNDTCCTKKTRETWQPEFDAAAWKIFLADWLLPKQKYRLKIWPIRVFSFLTHAGTFYLELPSHLGLFLTQLALSFIPHLGPSKH